MTKSNIESFDSSLQWAVPEIAETFASIWHVKVPPGFKTLSGEGG